MPSCDFLFCFLVTVGVFSPGKQQRPRLDGWHADQSWDVHADRMEARAARGSELGVCRRARGSSGPEWWHAGQCPDRKSGDTQTATQRAPGPDTETAGARHSQSQATTQKAPGPDTENVGSVSDRERRAPT